MDLSGSEKINRFIITANIMQYLARCYIAEIISPQPYNSVVVGLPYILRDGVCKKVTYRKVIEKMI